MPKKIAALVMLANHASNVYKIEDFEEVDFGIISFLEEKLNDFTDSRQEWKIEYKFSYVIIIIILCAFAKIDELEFMSICANDNIVF